MKTLFSLSLALYAAFGPLCPALFAETAQARMPEAVASVDHAHGQDHPAEPLQCLLTMAHEDCGNEQHCTLGERVDSAGAAEIREIPAACFVVVHDAAETAETDAAEGTSIPIARPPPLAPIATVVLRR